MTKQLQDGPIIVKGVNPAIGTTTGLTGVAGPPPYVSGVNENPDAGPSVFYAGASVRDERIFSRPDGVTLAAGGYANQDFCFPESLVLTFDGVLAATATAVIAALQHTSSGQKLNLVSSSGGGITVLTAPFTVPGFPNHIIPAGALRIDANPSYIGYGTSGAVQGWAAAAVGRALSYTTSASMSGVNLTANGWDIYGYPLTQTRALPGSGTTVTTLKGFKWLGSIVASATDGTNNVSVGISNVISFPLRADFWSDLLVWLGDPAGPANNLVTAATGFVPAVTTNPNTAVLGDVRGTYTVQSAFDGTIRLTIKQTIRAANAGSVAGKFGVAPV